MFCSIFTTLTTFHDGISLVLYMKKTEIEQDAPKKTKIIKKILNVQGGQSIENLGPLMYYKRFSSL